MAPMFTFAPPLFTAAKSSILFMIAHPNPLDWPAAALTQMKAVLLATGTAFQAAPVTTTLQVAGTGMQCAAEFRFATRAVVFTSSVARETVIWVYGGVHPEVADDGTQAYLEAVMLHLGRFGCLERTMDAYTFSILNEVVGTSGAIQVMLVALVSARGRRVVAYILRAELPDGAGGFVGGQGNVQQGDELVPMAQAAARIANQDFAVEDNAPPPPDYLENLRIRGMRDAIPSYILGADGQLRPRSMFNRRV